jgi:hypothetical protein
MNKKSTKLGWKGFKIGIQYNDNDNDHLFVCFGNGIIDPTYICHRHYTSMNNRSESWCSYFIYIYIYIYIFLKKYIWIAKKQPQD